MRGAAAGGSQRVDPPRTSEPSVLSPPPQKVRVPGRSGLNRPTGMLRRFVPIVGRVGSPERLDRRLT